MLDDIREKMDGWEQPAPEGLWERIEAARTETERKPAAGRGRRPVPVIRRVAAAAGAVAAAAALFLLTLPRQQTAGIMVADIPQVTTEQDRPAVQMPEKPAIEKEPTGQERAAAQQGLPEKSAPAGTGNNITEPVTTYNTELNSRGRKMSADTVDQTENEAAPENRVHEKAAGTDTGSGGMDNRLSNTGAREKDQVLSAALEEKRTRGLFSIGISASNSTGQSLSERKYTAMSGYSAFPLAMTASPTALWVDPEANIRRTNQGREVSSDTRHRLPVTTGIALRYRLPMGLGIETGVNYTWLSSTLTSGSEQSHYTSTREMHYIGIPLNISYTVWNSRYLGIYVSAGGLMEKCVGGSTLTQYTLNSETLGTDRREPLTVKPLQWSVNATAGVQLNITPAIGLYAEPGIAWWFDDGTDLETIYKTRPLNFYLRFGLRFSFEL